MKELRELINKINYYCDCYYNKNKSVISDKEFDELYDRLKYLEDTLGIIYPDSPTQHIGYSVVSDLKKVKHNHPLKSLDKTTNVNEFIKYFNGKPFDIMAKLDGLTISLRYLNGELVSAETRGNGEYGEDIIHNARTFVPTKIPFKGELIVDGEAIIDRKTFEKINNDLPKGVKKYKSPRNLASGSVRNLDSEICANRNVRFIAWNLYVAKPTAEEVLYGVSHITNLMLLGNLGFEVCDCSLITDPKNQVETTMDTIRKRCEDNGIPIDGLVGRFDDIEYGISLGSTDKFPRHSYAFKFYQERNETTLKDVEWNTSRTNVINPVAIFDPIEIDGATVSRATVNNVSQIKKLALGYGDSILVIKANQIIPQITENLDRSGTIRIPDVCPCCGAKTEIRSEGAAEILYCTNPKCKGAMLDRLVNFCGKNGMDIHGLSEERIKALLNCGYLSDFNSIYNLNLYKTNLEKLEGFGKSSVKKLLEAIEKSKASKFANVLVAIGIPSIGKASAKQVAKECSNSPDKFLAMVNSNYDWSKLPDFGKSTSKKINEYVKRNYDEIKAIFNELNCDEEVEVVNILNGKTFCITGKLIEYKNRDELIGDIEKYGGKVVSGVTSKTDYLITNNKDEETSKTKNAKKFGTKIISENDFRNLLKRE